MSITSYELNVSRRVTGKNKPTCFPAALEQISPFYEYDPDIYRDYSSFINWYCSMSLKKREKHVDELTEMYDELFLPLGGLSSEDALFRRASTPVGWMRIVRKLLTEDYGVVADIRYGPNRYESHAVGILPVPDAGPERVTLVSTHIPTKLQGVVGLIDVAQAMYYVPEIYATRPVNIDNANIVAIPKI